MIDTYDKRETVFKRSLEPEDSFEQLFGAQERILISIAVGLRRLANNSDSIAFEISK